MQWRPVLVNNLNVHAQLGHVAVLLAGLQRCTWSWNGSVSAHTSFLAQAAGGVGRQGRSRPWGGCSPDLGRWVLPVLLGFMVTLGWQIAQGKSTASGCAVCCWI